MAKMEDPVRSLRAKMASLMSRMVAMFVDASLRANFFALWRELLSKSVLLGSVVS